jgi:hypothetical protein
MYSKFFLRQEILEKVEKFLIFLIRHVKTMTDK